MAVPPSLTRARALLDKMMGAGSSRNEGALR